MFDAAKYKNSVLVPLAKDKGRLEVLQQVIRDVQGDAGVEAAARLDLAELFSVSASMSAQDLVAHLKSLEMTHNKQKSLPSSQLLKKLLELLKKAGEDVSDPAFWKKMSVARSQALKGQVDEFARAFAEEHPLKVVTPELVADSLVGVGLGALQMSDLESALSKHGVEIKPDFDLPKVSLPAAVRKAIEHPEFRTIIDVVSRPEKPKDVKVIDELTFGSPAKSITPGDVSNAKVLLQQQEAQVEEGARQAAQNALGALTDFKSGADLHALVLASLVEITENLLRRGSPRVTVRDELTKRGVHQVDASRLVAKLSASTQVLGVNDVAERLADGALGEARRILDNLPSGAKEDEAEMARVAGLVEAAELKKQGWLEKYESARRDRDYVAAATALRGALAVDTEDEELRSALERLPPLPPGNLSLRISGRAVDITWSPDAHESVQYSLLRTTAEVPVHQNDGRVLVSEFGGTTFRDESPPIGVEVRYSVFATRDGIAFSDSATAQSVVLPAPLDLNASAGTFDVSLSWSTPAEAAGALVTQTDPDGSRRDHRPTTPGQLSVAGLTTGTKYRFAVKALYILSDGKRMESAPVEVDATPRGIIRTVDDLRVESSPGGHRALWTTVVGYTVELWALPITAQPTAGTRMGSADLTKLGGRRLTLRPGSASGLTAREFDALTDVSLIVPLTLDGDGGLIGSPQVAGSAPSARKPTAERFGDELRVSWEWPKGDYVVEVGWFQGGTEQTRRVTRSAYNEDGGVRLPGAEGIRDVTVATVARAGAQEWVSSPLKVPVSGLRPAISYTLDVKRSRLGGRGTVSVSASAAQFRGKVETMLVLKEAKFMPSDRTDGAAVDRRTLDFSGGEVAPFIVELGKVSTPFWIRLFAATDSAVRVTDPPTSQMRG